MKYKRFTKDIIEVGLYFGAAFDHYTLWELGWFSVRHCFVYFQL